MAMDFMTVGTWNVRTLWCTGKLDLLRRESERYKCDILGLAEVRWTGKGDLNESEFIWSGENECHVRGVGFLLSSRARQALLGYNPVSSRIIVARFRGHPFDIACVQVYAPTAESSEEAIDDFYEQLAVTLESLPRKDVKIVMGDWNAKVGIDNRGWEKIMGKYGYGERNERGERLLEFASNSDLFVCNTRFQQKDCRKWTWSSPGDRSTNMIDLVLIDKRWKTSVRNCRSYQGADIDSDHSLILANIKLRLKKSRPRINKEPRLDLEVLQDADVTKCYEKELLKHISKRGVEDSLDRRAEALSEAMRETARSILPRKTKAKKPWISADTLKLVDEKRSAKLRRHDSEYYAEIYRRLRNAVTKSARRDKEDWLDKHCREIETSMEINRSKQAFQLMKQLRKKRRPSHLAIKDKNGTMLLEKDEIRRRWTEYCSELYENHEDHEDYVKELESIAPPPREDEDETILYSEVEAAIRKLRRNKSPGPDGISGEMIVAGGEAVARELHYLCNKAWLESRIPDEWTKSTLVVIPKKGDLSLCSNYRTIALMNHVCKILMLILLERLKTQIEPYIADTQAGFRKDHSTMQQILILRLIAQEAKKKNKLIFNNFIDFQKAFDTVNHSVLWAVLKSYGVGKRLLALMKNVSERSEMAVRFANDLGEWFKAEMGTKQGDPISPTSFIVLLERALMTLEGDASVTMNGRAVDNLKFADDIDLIEDSWESLQVKTDRLNEAAKKAGLRMNVNKTKTMVFGQKQSEGKIMVDGSALENVEQFEYLGSLITWDNDCSKEIVRRMAKAWSAMTEFGNIWKNKMISIRTKKRIIESCIFSVFLYACETWTLKQKDVSKILAFEMRCYRRALCINWTQKVRNLEVRQKIGAEHNLIQKVMKRKLSFFGHVCRMDDKRLVKNVIFGRMEGMNRRGRPCREWLDDVSDWCNEKVHVLYRWAQDRRMWRGIVERALVTYGLSAHGL